MTAQHRTQFGNTKRVTPTGITEIVLPPITTADGGELVLPMLAHLSQKAENRWFTWIGPEQLSRTKVQQYQLRDSSLRFIRSSNDKETLWMFWETLSNGNSATVVAMLDYIDEKNRRLLELAAERGGSLGIILRRRKH